MSRRQPSPGRRDQGLNLSGVTKVESVKAFNCRTLRLTLLFSIFQVSPLPPGIGQEKWSHRLDADTAPPLFYWFCLICLIMTF